MNNNKKSLNLDDLDEIIRSMPPMSPHLSKPYEEKKDSDKEELRKKLRDKTNNMRNCRMSKSLREEQQIKTLKENPAFQNNGSNDDVKNMIEKMASNMAHDPKQKKNLKKQMENLIGKMANPLI